MNREERLLLAELLRYAAITKKMYYDWFITLIVIQLLMTAAIVMFI